DLRGAALPGHPDRRAGAGDRRNLEAGCGWESHRGGAQRADLLVIPLHRVPGRHLHDAELRLPGDRGAGVQRAVRDTRPRRHRLDPRALRCDADGSAILVGWPLWRGGEGYLALLLMMLSSTARNWVSGIVPRMSPLSI